MRWKSLKHENLLTYLKCLCIWILWSVKESKKENVGKEKKKKENKNYSENHPTNKLSSLGVLSLHSNVKWQNSKQTPQALMDKRPKAKHIPNGVIVSSSQSFKHCSHLHARPSKTNSIRHKTKPPSLHVVSSPTAWAHGLLMSQHYRPNPEPLSSLSLSLYRSLFCYIHIFTTPPTHPPTLLQALHSSH